VVKYRDHACFKRILVHAHVDMYDALSSTHVAARACTSSPACNALQGRVFKVPECREVRRGSVKILHREFSLLTDVSLLFNIASSHGSITFIKRLLSVIDLSIIY